MLKNTELDRRTPEQQVARTERKNYIEYLKFAGPCIIIQFK
jgi:hypothetical protein